MSSFSSSGGARAFRAAALLVATATLSACGGSEFSAAEREGSGGSGSGGSASGGTSGKGASGGSDATGGSNATGGSGGAGATGGSGGAGGVVAGCIAYSRAYCAWAERCGSYLFGGTVEACESISEDSCAWADLPGIAITGADYDACAARYENAACDGATLACDLPNGTIQNGDDCASASQCASGYCTGGNGACGVCTPNPRHPAGGTCENPLVDCEAEHDCVDRVCTPKRDEGEPCDDTHHCKVVRALGFLECVEGTCTATGLPGEACVMSNDGNPMCGYNTGCTTENVCVELETAEEGDECGTFADRVVTCPDGTCVVDEDDPEVSRCVSWGKGGESCRKVPNFERCAAGLVCESSICVWPEVTPPPDDCG